MLLFVSSALRTSDMDLFMAPRSRANAMTRGVNNRLE